MHAPPNQPTKATAALLINSNRKRGHNEQLKSLTEEVRLFFG